MQFALYAERRGEKHALTRALSVQRIEGVWVPIYAIPTNRRSEGILVPTGETWKQARLREGAAWVQIPLREGPPVTLVAGSASRAGIEVEGVEEFMREILTRHDPRRRLASSRNMNVGQRPPSEWRYLCDGKGDIDRIELKALRLGYAVVRDGPNSLYIAKISATEITRLRAEVT